MNLADLASFFTVLSGLAVCGSLIYLGLQVRQSDRNQRTLLQQGTSNHNMESIWRFAEPQNAEIYAKVLGGEMDLTNTQAIQLVFLVRASLLGFQDQFLLHKLSLIDSVQLESQERAMTLMFSVPAMRAVWNRARETYAPDFARYLDGLLKELPLSKPLDMAANIREAVTDLAAAEVT